MEQEGKAMTDREIAKAMRNASEYGRCGICALDHACGEDTASGCLFKQAADRLEHYAKLEEEGRLVELPYPVGTKGTWNGYNGELFNVIIRCYRVNRDGIEYYFEIIDEGYSGHSYIDRVINPIFTPINEQAEEALKNEHKL
jgi:hypothetical protein